MIFKSVAAGRQDAIFIARRPINGMQRVVSGIHGLDPFIGGGFIPHSANLVTGTTGTGKTIFCAQFLWHGLQKGETGVFITLEEDPEEIKEDVSQFGWDFSRFEKKGLFRMIYHDPAQVSNIGSLITEEIRKLKARRLVIDSTSILGMALGEEAQIRKKLLNIISAVKNRGVTAILTAEIAEESKALSRFGVEEFVCDSVILLHYLGIGEQYNRSLLIRKMRRTNHGKDVYPFEITSKGIHVKRPE